MAGNIKKLTELYNTLWQMDKGNRKQYHNLWYKIIELESEVSLPELVVFHCQQTEKYQTNPFRSGYHNFKARLIYDKNSMYSADLEALLYKNTINLKSLEIKEKLSRKKDLASKEKKKILFQAARHADSYLN